MMTHCQIEGCHNRADVTLSFCVRNILNGVLLSGVTSPLCRVCFSRLQNEINAQLQLKKAEKEKP